jgi:Ser-tRNA(Ala) deacylase AlaX
LRQRDAKDLYEKVTLEESMTAELYLEDSYLKECPARVVSITQGKYVVLNQTIFYPRGGGQPEDTGTIVQGSEVYQVTFVGKFSGNVSHEVDRVGLKVGDAVTCVLDWDRRFKLMRSHTAAHVLAALLCTGTGALITGNQLGVDRTRFDFSLEHFDRSLLLHYVDAANDLCTKDIPVKCYELPREEALRIPGIIKMAKALPPQVRSLRVVEIVGVDVQADGGTHVHNLREVGQIRFLDAQNKGKHNRRVYFSLEET